MFSEGASRWQENHAGQSALPRVMFVYWGRRGLSRLVLQVARTALASRNISATISVSRQNENFSMFDELGHAVVPVDTFSNNSGVLLHAWRIPLIRRQLLQFVTLRRPDVIIELMPHAWSSFVAPVFKAAGIRYVAVVHDAMVHPGDHRSASVEWLTKRTLRQADLILTLSSNVAEQLRTKARVSHDRISSLFHPDLDFGSRRTLHTPRPEEPFRLCFFGRIMPYKGLPLFLDMIDELRRRGAKVQVGVFGEGPLGASAQRLANMGAEVANRWLSESEIEATLPRFDAIVLSHIEASQSGVAAMAFGAGLPVIATPVGGLVEQVMDGITGVLAKGVDAASLADAVWRLQREPALYRRICQNLVDLKEDRSVERFVEESVRRALKSKQSVRRP